MSRRHEVTLRTSTWVVVALDALAESGRFPGRREAVAEELLRAKLREIEREGWLGKTTPLRALGGPRREGSD